MAIENLTTFTEVDVGANRISVTATRVTVTDLDQDEDVHLYKDKGASYYAANFEIDFTAAKTSTGDGNIGGCVALSDSIGSYHDIDLAGGNVQMADVYKVTGTSYIRIIELDAGTEYILDEYAITIGTAYYCTLKRDESVGTYGTLYLHVYSDAARTTLLQTLSGALHAKRDLRYLYAMMGVNSSNTGGALDYYVEAVEEVAVTSTPKVSTQPCTDIIGTTATGHGSITDLGSSSVTEHGHCWLLDDGVPTEPTTANSKTTNGAGSLGDFTSSVTGLTEGLLYRIRAYATNGQGTSYGGTVTFRAGRPSTQLTPREIAVGDTTFLYVSESGQRYYVQGVAY